MVAITIEVDEETQRRLERVSLQAGGSIPEITYEALLSHIEDLEDVIEAEAALARLTRGKEGTISLEEWGRLLDLDH